ncbi:MAG: CDP-diacylglycerol-serine O-phosphatidyltransferase [Candidatus Phytoplasma cynodontis]|uniref:CDP-alcohol phosphatidyltransferase family protein n=1 Tax='Cynodon dactylon' phytoplasma TaxID=295320 RepID=UPI001265C0D5|nr:CDP-alcohol phosphatidyltransferase family protein ['Cynodon dactylon' phytoplasma]KAB8121702.1 hypothetical protein F1741_02075 ['Cynodon dactylon' phytoplasma]WIA07674.1 MAG: CDP-diacylglycerol-serine O-phosphatidyltransferase [Candidatus Phytoplasma cynodontis]
MFLGFYNYTVILTYLNLLSGFTGIILSIQNYNFVNASIFLLISGIFDIFDGFISRLKTKRSIQEKKYGIQIDSLADIVSFGILPIFIGWSFLKKEYISNKNFIFLFSNSLESFQVFFLFCCSFYILSVLIRLAYFNVTMEIDKKTKFQNYYVGIPVTFSSIIFPFLILLQNISKKYFNQKSNFFSFYLDYYIRIFPLIYLFFVLLLSFLFIFEKIKIKKNKNIFFIFCLTKFFLILIFSIYYFDH